MSTPLKLKIEQARKQWRFFLLIGGVSVAAGILMLAAIVSFWSDRLVVFSNMGRYGWFFGLIGIAVAGVIWFVILPAKRPLTDEQIAVEIEREFPALNERLLTTISLSKVTAPGVSMTMAAQLALETDTLSQSLNFLSAVPRKPVQRPVYFGGFAAALLSIHFLTMPLAMGAWLKRILFPAADIPIYSYTQVWVGPGDIVHPRGDEINLSVTTSGLLPKTATLKYRFENGPWIDAPLSNPSRNGDKETFGLKLPALQRDITYFAISGDGQSNPHTVIVEDRPTILNVKLNLTYPTYMHRKADTFSATSGNIVAPVGTEVSVEATANKTIQSAELQKDEKGAGLWHVAGDTITGNLRVTRDETYGFKLVDNRGFKGLNPPVYTVRAQQDQPPTVRIEKPATDLERTPYGSVNLTVFASDDYGISDLRLDYSSNKRNGAFPLPDMIGKKSGYSGGTWNLSSLRLQGGDTVTYEAVAVDNDTVSGPHVAKSTKYNVKIISVTEMRERLEAQKSQENEMLKQLVEQQKDAQKQLSKAMANPTNHQQMMAAEQAQRQVANAANEALQRMQQTSEQMRENNLGGKNELQRRQQQETNLSSLAKQQMPAAADSIQQNKAESAADQEQSIREQLEKLTQKTAASKDAFQLAQEAERLSQEQQKLADQSALIEAQRSGRNDNKFTKSEQQQMADIAKRQQSLSQATKSLQESINQSATDASEKGQPEATDLKKASQQLSQQGTAQKQSGAQKNLQQSNPDAAAQQQAQAAQDLQNLAQSLDRAAEQQQQNADQQKSAAERMQKIADDLQAMAFKENQIANAANKNPGKETAEQLAKQQADLKAQADRANQQMAKMGQQSQPLSRASQNMQQAQQNLEKGQPQSATPNAKEAQRQLLQAAMDAQQAATAMNNAEEARQQQKAVEKLAKEQRALLAQTEQLDKTRPQTGLTPDQTKRLQSIAKSQNALTDKAKEAANDMPSEAYRWVMRQVQERMNAAGGALNRNDTSDETRQRQENAAQLLERMARSLGQEAQSQEEQAQNSSQQSSSQSQQEKATGELEMARELQAQVRQETTNLDERRAKNPDRKLSASQQRELERLTNAQSEAQYIARNAARNLKSNPDILKMVQNATDNMEDAKDMLSRQQETNSGTQQKQQSAVNGLDKAISQMEQQQRQQRQQMAQAQKGQKPGQQPGQQASQQNQPGGNNLAQKTFAPKTQASDATLHPYDPRGKGFSGLSARAQQAMKEGQQDKVPAEYRDLVNQYYKALSQRAK